MIENIERSFEDDCAFNFANDVIFPKWNVNIILEFITEGSSLSFGQISATIPEISPRMLSMRLKFLIDSGILSPLLADEDKPKKLRYELTQSGKKLAVVLKYIREWSLEYGTCTNDKCHNNECRHGKAISKLINLNNLI
ncbi:MAG: helix-turn-helix transcriptional regulator [Candidatus Heimdallarchaeota archaeon]|nr:helix-turn-helix transcriptional regulator [Candidatus Heimdallarchaeota archaeon]